MSKKKRYQTTKKRCLEMINGVCSSCGGKLTAIKTVDNSGNPTFWGGCEKCSKLCWGVDVKIWKTARILVEKRRVIAYSSMKESEYKSAEEKEYWLNVQTSGVTIIVADVLVEYNKLVKGK